MIHVTDKSKSGFMLKMAMGKGASTGQKKPTKTQQECFHLFMPSIHVHALVITRCDGQISSMHTVAIKINFPFRLHKISIVFYAVSGLLLTPNYTALS